ncbi:MAG: molybdenum ABC transporter ATP-binding protein [Acidobacteria bacterium]|nr:MAG: molybdenum ABC transporter ATP-binding protein [Acidobacteriota bacterium]
MSAATLTADVRLALDRFELAAAFTTAAPVTGIFGPSGAGKTSLLEAIAGLRRGARGRIALGDDVWLDSDGGRFLPPERRHLGYVPQDGLLFPHLDVRANLLAGARRARRAGGDPAATLAAVAALLELEPLLDRPTTALSGGERQRVALGRALCSGPRLLLLDEPLASLDLPLRRRLLPFLRRVREELTVPMLLVSHDPIEVQALCDDLLALHAGRVVARGTPRQVLTDPEVFPLAERQGFENVLPGRLAAHRDGTSEVRLGDGDGAVVLITNRSDAALGEEVLVGIPASDVMIASRRPSGLSARNVLPAEVTSIRPLERLALVTARIAGGVPPLTVEVTEATPAELGLDAGGRIYLVIKATSCRLYGGASRVTPTS